jgi:hypothetical protein
VKNPQAKVGRVMREFKAGKLKSSSGQKVTNPKQAIAIGLSEAGISKKAKGGEMKESKAMMKKEVSFMKKKGAPKSMLKHEMAEMKGMKKGGKVKKMAMGGMGQRPLTTPGKPMPTMPSKPMSLPRRGSGPNDAGPMKPLVKPPVSRHPSDFGLKPLVKPPVSRHPSDFGLKKGGSVKKMASGGKTKKYC